MNIILYQIIPELDIKNLMFNSLGRIKDLCGDKIPAEIYESIFSGEVEADDLEDVFDIFNNDFPDGYRGRSMSVSDVLEVADYSCKSKFYFCDNIGFKEVEFEKEKAMTAVLNHNFDCVQKKKENVSVFFVVDSGLKQVICKTVEISRCKYSETQLGYRILCKTKDGKELKFDFSERPSVILSNCKEKFPHELLYIDDKRTRYSVHYKENLGIVCTWLMRKGYIFESF